MRPRLLVLLAAGLLFPRPALPSPEPADGSGPPATVSGLELAWDAPEGCPDGKAVRAQVLRLAGATTQASRLVRAKGAIRSVGTGLILSLVTEFDAVAGERTLRGVSCDSLTTAAALVLAMIVNPDMAVSPPAAVAPEAPSPASAPAVRAIWQVGAHTGVQTGVIGDPSPFYGLSVGIALGRLSLHLLPSLTPPQDVFIPGTQPRVGGRLWLAAADALVSWSLRLGPVVFRPCLGWNVSRLHGRGLGVVQASQNTVYWSAAELAMVADLRLGRHLLVEIGGMAQVPLHRPRFYLDDIGAVSRPAAFGFKALGGLAWVFE